MERLLLLDSDVIIDLHSSKLWNGVEKSYGVCVASSVLHEVLHYKDGDGNKIPLDLIEYANANKIKELSASPEDLRDLIIKLQPSRIGLDPGESESIAIIAKEKDDKLKFCVIDKAAIQAIAFLDLGSRAMSVEEALVNIGLCKRSQPPLPIFSKKRFDFWLTQGNLILIANSSVEPTKKETVKSSRKRNR